MKNRNRQYWNEISYQEALLATSYGALGRVALAILYRMPPFVGMVCGPITTGGLGSLELNLLLFNETIETLVRLGVNLFDQVPFEEYIARIADDQGARNNHQLLREFYLPLLETKRITRLYFIKGWESSEGARWEHEQGKRLGIEIAYL